MTYPYFYIWIICSLSWFI